MARELPARALVAVPLVRVGGRGDPVPRRPVPEFHLRRTVPAPTAAVRRGGRVDHVLGQQRRQQLHLRLHLPRHRLRELRQLRRRQPQQPAGGADHDPQEAAPGAAVRPVHPRFAFETGLPAPHVLG